jgi:hypothetical protein
MKWNLSTAALEFGASRETISRGLRANGVTVTAGNDYTTRQIYTALAGDLKYERTRRERAEADKAERENKIASGELHNVNEVEKLVWQDVLAPLRTELLTLHLTLGPKCVDAENAMEAIKCWADETLKKIGNEKSK